MGEWHQPFEESLAEAVQFFWAQREKQTKKQVAEGVLRDARRQSSGQRCRMIL